MGRKAKPAVKGPGGNKVPQSSSNNNAPTTTGVPPPSLLSAQPPPKLPYLQPVTLLSNYIWVLPNFFSRQECQHWIDFMEGQEPLDYVKQRGTRYLAARECFRWSSGADCSTLSHRIFERLRDHTQLLQLLPTNSDGERPVTCNPNLRLYKYGPGMSFGKHIDEANVVKGHGVTRMTVLIYLSECRGGATRFEGDIAFEPKVGAILLHVHGEDLCLEHEADPVVTGVKYVLRTDLVYST